jgi:14-3-3 protein epsilon
MNQPGDLVYLIRVAQELDRPQDMVPLAKQLLTISPHLDRDELIAFSSSYHNSVRALLQSLSVIQPYLETADTAEKRATAQQLFSKLCRELHSLCHEVIQITDDIALPAAEKSTDLLFYNKLKGDYWRYDAEFQTGEQKEVSIAQAGKCYERAMSIAEAEIDLTHPMRLGLILNYCVFLVDVKGEKEIGRTIARTTIEESEALISESDPQRQDADICLKLLRDNLEHWCDDE